MRIVPFCILIVISACSPAPKTDRFERMFSGEMKVVDLTHSLSHDTPYWPNDEGNPFHYDTLFKQPSGAPGMGAYRTSEHFGTHLDAPIHSADHQPSVDELQSRDLFGPAAVINVEDKCVTNPDYLLSVEDVMAWEKSNGQIPDGAIVIMFSGWSKKWDNYDAYKNEDVEKKMHFPGFSAEAATFLIEERIIRGIGIDNLSVDAGSSKGFPVHKIVNGAGKFHLENVAEVHLLPAAGAYLIVAPIKIKGGSGGQVRIFAAIPETQP